MSVVDDLRYRLARSQARVRELELRLQGRRRAALELQAWGWSNRRIAEQFGISLAEARILTMELP